MPVKTLGQLSGISVVSKIPLRHPISTLFQRYLSIKIIAEVSFNKMLSLILLRHLCLLIITVQTYTPSKILLQHVTK